LDEEISNRIQIRDKLLNLELEKHNEHEWRDWVYNPEIKIKNGAFAIEFDSDFYEDSEFESDENEPTMNIISDIESEEDIEINDITSEIPESAIENDESMSVDIMDSEPEDPEVSFVSLAESMPEKEEKVLELKRVSLRDFMLQQSAPVTPAEHIPEESTPVGSPKSLPQELSIKTENTSKMYLDEVKIDFKQMSDLHKSLSSAGIESGKNQVSSNIDSTSIDATGYIQQPSIVQQQSSNYDTASPREVDPIVNNYELEYDDQFVRERKDIETHANMKDRAISSPGLLPSRANYRESYPPRRDYSRNTNIDERFQSEDPNRPMRMKESLQIISRPLSRGENRWDERNPNSIEPSRRFGPNIRGRGRGYDDRGYYPYRGPDEGYGPRDPSRDSRYPPIPIDRQREYNEWRDRRGRPRGYPRGRGR
jgi:hypothetical protein